MWNNPYIATGIEAGPIKPQGWVNRQQAGMMPFAQGMAASNPIPSFGFGFNPQQQAQLGQQMQAGVRQGAQQQGLGFQRQAREQNAQFDLRSQQARSQAGLQGGQYALGQQQEEMQRQQQMMRMLMGLLGQWGGMAEI